MAHWILHRFLSLNFRIHLGIALLIRISLVCYGLYHDQVSTVPYTDVDYKVFTDAARHILDQKSPYERHTYRYSPALAFLLIPNLLVHETFGKVLFSLIDLIDGILIKSIVIFSIKQYYSEKSNKQVSSRKRSRQLKDSSKVNNFEYISTIAMIFWLYNPLNIAISTRGNCDSIAVFFVLVTLYLLQCKQWYFIAGLFHGISIHFRLYPIIYSLSMYISLSSLSFYSTEDRRKTQGVGKCCDTTIATNTEKRTIFKLKYLQYLVPNFKQFQLVQGCVLSLLSLTSLFYWIYGYQFLYETYLYHLVRKDHRHNFSLYFYLQYLTAWIKNIGMWQKVLIGLPQIVLLLVFSFRYALNRFSLNFCILVQTVVMVTYNTVLTSQYFVWILGILPLCLWQIKMPLKTTVFLLIVWFVAQGCWLLPAYFLEFHGQNTFLFIWIQSVSFFCANIAILGRLIMYFTPSKINVHET